MLISISNEELQSIDQLRTSAEKAITDCDYKKARAFDMQASNLCVSVIYAELDRANKSNAH